MTAHKTRSTKRERTTKQPKGRSIVEEVEKFEDLPPRMLELIEREQKGDAYLPADPKRHQDQLKQAFATKTLVLRGCRRINQRKQRKP